jgi:uncharacterized GH25 family protein
VSKPSRGAFTLALFGVLVSAPALAHDFWIEPSSFHPALGSELRVSLRVGQDFRGDPVPRDDRRIVKFVLVSPRGEQPVPGLPATDPAGFARIDQPGLLTIAYRSSRSPLVLEPEKFEKYLAEEGLERILEVRRSRGERENPGREVFSRCAKSLIRAGGSGAPGADQAVGFTLELVLEKDPTRLGKTLRMPVRLLYDGKPLSGALVVAMNQSDPSKKLTARSDREGRALFTLPARGVWLIKAVHMIPAPPETSADWESLWASLTFEVP